jgi:hypothetical protein
VWLSFEPWLADPNHRSRERLLSGSDVGALAIRGRRDKYVDMPTPSRADLLKNGGIYPVIVPLGWKLVGPAGEDIAIQAVPGHPVHRILAQGALLATEESHDAQREMMTVRPYPLPGPVTPDILDRYTKLVLESLTKKGLKPRLEGRHFGICALSHEPCGKVVMSRMSPQDDRMEIHFVLRDQKREGWELTYLIRRAEVERWRLLLAEIDGPILT